MSRLPETAIRWQVLCWSAMLLVTGALSLATAWSHWLPALVLVLAAITPLLLLLAVTGLGVSRRIATLVLVILLVLTAYFMSARAETSLLTSLSDSIPLLLTEPRPFAVRADLLVAPVMITAVLSLLVGLRIRSRGRMTAVVSGLMLYVCGALLSSGQGDPWGILGISLLVLILFGWTLLDDHNEPVAARLGMAGPLAVVGVGLLGSIALMPVTHAFDPRDLVDPPIVEVDAVSPLPQLGAWAVNPDVELMRVRGDAVPLRLVTLDTFDGTSWNAATEYVPFGTRVPQPLPTAPDRQSARVQITVQQLGGVWLPTPGQPESVSDRAALVDPITGTLFQPELDEGLRYEVEGLVDRPDDQTLADASVPTGAAAKRWLTQPQLPYDLARYAAEVTRDVTTPYDRALAIEAAVRGDRKLSKHARSGSDYGRIMTFLFGSRGESGAGVGTSEQFAGAFAIIARHNGLPTRIVVGFEPGKPQADGTRIVRGRDARAWPEVYFEGQGWVPFYPSPERGDLPDRPGSSQQPDGGQTEPSEGSPSARPSAGEDETTITPAPEPTDAGAAGGGVDWPSPWWLLTLLPATLLVLWLLRRIRSWRHRRRGAPGAWSELLDALVLAGTPALAHQSPGQIGAFADERFGTGSASRLARAAERVAFAPDPAAGPTRTDVRSDLRAVRKGARRSVPLWRRWWWPFDPRVLTPR